MAKESIVIVGTGWAGYTVSQRLDDKKFDITVISPEDTSPYTPLLVGRAFPTTSLAALTEDIEGKRSVWSI